MGPGTSWNKKLTITHWTDYPAEATIENNGHTLKMFFEYENDQVPTLSGGPLLEEYELVEIHFHLGEPEKPGSEHTINDHKFDAEAHMVFFNPKYDSFAKAQYQKDGLAVIGRFYEFTQDSSAHYDFIPFLSFIQEVNSQYTIENPEFTLDDIFGPSNFNYYSYAGSLTTPPCFESVRWIVIDSPMMIHADDLVQISLLDGDEGTIAPNYRPVQPEAIQRPVKYYKYF